MTAMVSVLNQRWLANAWRVMSPADAEPMALIWIAVLDRAGVPYQQYQELYHRAIELRARRMSQGMGCDDFSADMMAACWPSLRDELKQREIDRGRTLPATAESQCERCYGTGMESVYDIDGRSLGSRKGCDHRALVEGEWLFEKGRQKGNVVAIGGGR